MQEETQDADGPVEQPPGHREVREFMLGDTLPKILATLKLRYRDAQADAEDAITDAVAKFLAKTADGEVIEKPASWIFVTAERFLLNKLERQVNRETDDGPLGSRGAGSVDAELLDQDTFTYLTGLVRRWESQRLSTITLLFLAAEFDGEVLTHARAADEASEILDEDVPISSVAKTRSRGFERLRKQILEIAKETGINPVSGNE